MWHDARTSSMPKDAEPVHLGSYYYNNIVPPSNVRSLHLLYPTLQLTHLLFPGRSDIRPIVYSDSTKPRTHHSSHTHQAARIRCSILKGACSPTFPATILLWWPQFLSPIPYSHFFSRLLL